MSISYGYCYAYRKAWYHPAFNNLREASIWNYLYQNAFYEDGESNIGGYTFELKRGQIAVSISYLAKGFCMSDKGVRVVIQKLEKLGMVGVRGTSRGSIITICNYEEYQRKEKTKGEQKGKQRANGGRAEGENKNEDKEDKKDNEGNEGGENFILPLPEWLPIEDWNNYLEMRIGKKKPAGNIAKQQTIIKLDELRKSGNDVSKVLRESIINGWTSVFAINKSFGKSVKQSIHKDERETLHLGVR